MRTKMLAIIPARGLSKGIAKKNIKQLVGKPLIVFTIEAALKSKYIDKIAISTDSNEVAKVCEKYRTEVIIRPKELAKDRTPTIDTVFHTLDSLEKIDYIPDIAILLQPTSPLRSTKDIDNAIEIFLKNNCESVVSVCEVKHSPYWSFKIKDKFLIPIFGKKYLKTIRQELPKSYIPNGAIFISKPETLRRYQSFYASRTTPYIMPPSRSVDVDDELDLILVEWLIKKYRAE